MKLILVYNSRCERCLPYVMDVQQICQDLEFPGCFIDLDKDIFNSIDSVVRARISISEELNELPLLILEKDGRIVDAFTGIMENYDVFSIVSKLLFV